jgi:hypothetical protein
MEVDPDAVAAAALSSPGVAGVSAGMAGEAATYLPGRRVDGVRVTGDEVEVHIIARWGLSLPAVADTVRLAVKPFAGGLPTSVYVDDIELPEEWEAGGGAVGQLEQGAGSDAGS